MVDVFVFALISIQGSTIGERQMTRDAVLLPLKENYNNYDMKYYLMLTIITCVKQLSEVTSKTSGHVVSVSVPLKQFFKTKR